MNEAKPTIEDYKNLALDSIDYVERLLNRFRKHLMGFSKEQFTDLEINDLLEILGFEDYELQQILELEFK